MYYSSFYIRNIKYPEYKIILYFTSLVKLFHMHSGLFSCPTVGVPLFSRSVPTELHKYLKIGPNRVRTTYQSWYRTSNGLQSFDWFVTWQWDTEIVYPCYPTGHWLLPTTVYTLVITHYVFHLLTKHVYCFNKTFSVFDAFVMLKMLFWTYS